MKLNINLLIVATLLCSFSMKIYAQDNYTLLVMGDQGQYEAFSSEFDKNEIINLENGCHFTNKKGEKFNLYNSTLNKFDDDNGLKNFNGIISTTTFQTLKNNSNGIVFLGDVVYTESNKVSVETEKNTPIWINRLNCGWNIFIGKLKLMGLIFNDLLDSKVEILSGNHSYDVNIDVEREIVNGIISRRTPVSQNQKEEWLPKNDELLKKDKTTFKNFLKFIQFTGKNFVVNMIDFNSALIACLTGKIYESYQTRKKDEEYNNCYHISKKYSKPQPTILEALKYYEDLYNAIESKFTIDTKSTNTYWNVLRAHHPPVNFEDGDSLFYFDKLGKDKTLSKLFKDKNVNIFFGSHIHSQGIMLVPFDEKVVQPKKKILNKVKNAKNEEVDETEYGCYIADNNIENKKVYNPTLQTCTDNLQFNFKINNSDAMIVFITGNSGRRLDNIANGSKSVNGYVIWNRRVLTRGSESWGFSHAKFSKDNLIVDFYELQSGKTDLTKVATAKVEKTNKKRRYLKK